MALAASGGATVMKAPSTYVFNTVGAKYPFPAGHAFSNCTYPKYSTDTVATMYTNWKSKFFQLQGQVGRIIRPENANDTVSEGIGYGMLIGVYMNDRPMFDALWAYAQSKFDGSGLMNWQIAAGGNVIGNGSATDGDEDMAWALLQAASQWGGTYKTDAIKLVENIWNKEVDQGGGNVLKPGENFGGSAQTDPSYFAPAYYRAFAKVTSHDWMSVVDSSYTILQKASGSYGLVPNWASSTGAGVNGPNNDPTGLLFGFDATRTPWRIAHDYCENGDPRAKAYLDKITGFFAGKVTVLGDLGSLKATYTPAGAEVAGSSAGMSLMGPVGVGSMVGGHPDFTGLVYEALALISTDPTKMSINGVYTYYHASWAVLSVLMMSGNFWNLP